MSSGTAVRVAPLATEPTGDRGIDPTLRRRWRRSRILVGVGAVVVIVALAGALASSAQQHGDLDPRSYDPHGTHALNALLGARGVRVTTVTDPGAALQQATAGSTLVVVHPERIPDDQLAALASAPADLLLVGADPLALAQLGFGVHAAGGAANTATVAPGCRLPAATTAGTIRLDGEAYLPPPSGQGCYRIGGGFGLVTTDRDARRVTLLGSGTPLTNAQLDEQGDAALGLGLLDATPRVVWLVPALLPAQSTGTHRSVTSLLPSRLKWAALQLALAVVVIAFWRGRRFGRLVAERVPVVVRQSESIFGRARLYRRARARDRVAATLRAGAAERLARRLGFGMVSSQPGVVEAVARRTGRSAAQVDALLYGSTPADDHGLVVLAHDLTALEQEVSQP